VPILISQDKNQLKRLVSVNQDKNKTLAKLLLVQRAHLQAILIPNKLVIFLFTLTF
jgi:hypothetical protein